MMQLVPARFYTLSNTEQRAVIRRLSAGTQIQQLAGFYLAMVLEVRRNANSK